VRPLGAVTETPVNVRIVSATHRDLGAEVQAGRFRQDLYYRLNVIRIAVPPLRERIADLPGLSAAVIERIARDAGVTPVPTLVPDALQHLLRYTFPGNVRELENLLHRALALAGGPAIGRDDLGLPEELLADAGTDSVLAPLADAALSAPGALAGPQPGLPSDLATYLDDVERDILERALERHRYNRTAAGASLGLSLRQMRYRMARLGVGVNDGDAP
jgi:two-component system response regulator PilR (NtrC family)